jgi:hypothetical protein
MDVYASLNIDKNNNNYADFASPTKVKNLMYFSISNNTKYLLSMLDNIGINSKKSKLFKIRELVAALKKQGINLEAVLNR